MLLVAMAIGALLVYGAVIGGVVSVVVHDQQRADASRQRAVGDLSIALKDYQAMDSRLKAAQPKFAQEMVAFLTATKLVDYGNLYLVTDQSVPQAEGPLVDEYLRLRRDLASFESATAHFWVREADGKAVAMRLDAAIDG